MTEFQIVDITRGFKILEIQDGVSTTESNLYAKGNAKLAIEEELIKIEITDSENEYRIPIAHLTVPANDGSISDVFNKITTIIY